MRLDQGGLVDRARRLPFTFDGRALHGLAGDTLASAMLANGVRLAGRSFKYHRPRGILTAGSEEPNALVELRTGARREPNTRATVVELFEGLEAASQNCWPSVGFDLAAVNSLLSPVFVAGFYYKTFMWPAALWEKLYEPLIRRAAGLGRVSAQRDPDPYEKVFAFCDVLVIGAGPAGLAAALAAGRSGARVMVCDEDFVLGGRLNGDRQEVDGLPGPEWARRTVEELRALPQVRVLPRTTVFGAYDSGDYGALQRVCDHLPEPPEGLPRQRYWKITARRAVLAAGALERPLVFGGNDIPGVMMASAVRTYANRFGVAAGRGMVLFTTNDDGWKTAMDLGASGVRIEAVVDARREVAEPFKAWASRAQVRLMANARVVEAHGGKALSGVTVVDSEGAAHRLRVDLLAMSGGWNPTVSLSTHLGGRPKWREDLSAFVPGEAMPAGMKVAGAAAGSLTLAAALREGTAAGIEAAEATGHRASAGKAHAADDEAAGVAAFWHVAPSRTKAFVDFQHDVTSDDVALAAREGFTSVEHLKRYTTLGMATDQGKTSNVNGLAILASLTGRSIPEVGTTVFRPPYSPVAIGAIATHHRGRDFRPTRLTAGHAWAAERNATFVEAGPWMRAQWFTAAGESREDWLASTIREVKATRASVGMCDVSTLGKIDIQGADAAGFLDRVYCNTFSTLPPGKVRYGLMLREDGIVLDDGTTAHLSAGHYVMSTTTANAARVMQHLEHARQVLWPELDVQMVSVTEQWSQYAIAGPNARRLLQRLLGDAIDVSNEGLPYLACAEFSWNGVPARLFRISFSGELAYELAVPARHGDAAIRAVMEAGAEWKVTPYGTEALGVMRIEKGHVAGNELNGQTTAADLGLGKMMSAKKDYIGRAMAQRPGLADPDRPSLVGLRPVDRNSRIHAGAHFLARGARPSFANDEGYVTSVAHSPMLGHWIGLGMLARGPRRHGEIVRAFDPVRGRDTEVEVVSPAFFDPEGARLRT